MFMLTFLSNIHPACHYDANGIKAGSNSKLELMFMKHYAPNRCLYIKVAKLRTGGGGECRDVTPTKSLSQNIRVDVNREVKFL